jgi:O-antigen ligase
MNGVAEPHPLPLPRSRELVPLLRDGCLAALFVAMAFSISATQIALACLVGLSIPWGLAGRALGAGAGVGGAVRALWAASADLRRHPLTAPFAAFAALTLLSALASGDPLWSLWIARDLVRITVFYVVLVGTRDSSHALRLWQGFVAVLTVMACYGLAQAWMCGTRSSILSEGWAADICNHSTRVRGPFSIYMTFGGVLLIGALFVLAYLSHVSWQGAWWMMPAGVVTLAALAFTYSRNAWLGLLAGILGLAVTARRPGRTAVVLLAVGLVVGVAAPRAVVERARSTVDLKDTTIRDRLAMWRSGLAMIADHPALGVGPGEVRAWYGQYRRPEAVRPSTGHLHNSAVQIAAERGLPALAVWLWIWITFFREGRRILRRLDPGPSRERALVSASLVGVAGFLVAGLFEHNFGDGEVVLLVYALMALPFVVARESQAALAAAPKSP